MSVRVVDAGLVKDKTPQSDRFLKNTYQATIAPGLPPLIFTTDYINDSRMFPKNYAPNASGIISGQGVYGPAGYTSSDRNDDVIVRFPAGSGASPLYISSVEVLNPESLHQRQLAETDIRNRIDAAIKAEENRKYLFGKAGIQDTPVYTPEMVKAANAALSAGGSMALSRAPGMIQLSAAGVGTLPFNSSLAGWEAGALWRGVDVLARIAPVASAVATVATVLTLVRAALDIPAAGEGSDRVPGRNIDMLAAQASLYTAMKTNIQPGMKTVDLPVRGYISYDGNGRQSVNLVRTGTGGVSATVPVLSAVRDKTTGLDKITVPAVAGAPSRTILINPVPVGPAAPSHTGSSTPVPVTPVHTGTDVKQADSIVTTTLPAADIPALQDFIYWQPDATGTGVEPVYVMLSGPYGETNAKGKYSGRDYNTDKAGGPIQNLDWKGAKIDRAGVDKVKLHTGRFGESPDNKVMIDRLEKILKGELQATDTDKRFYTREVRELERYRNLGIKDGLIPENYDEVWNNTHTATLEDYKINEKKQPLYTPEANEAYRKAEEGK